MHIEFATPRIQKSNSHHTSQMIVREAMQRWAQAYPTAQYSIHADKTNETLWIRFDNPAWVTQWMLTWDQYRGNFHSTAWKRIKILSVFRE